jgi:hypothetical protein
MEQETKVLENRLRRMAERRGYRIEKSRRRDPMAVDFGGYQLIDAFKNTVVLGCRQHEYDATLQEIESFLNDPRNLGHSKA